MIKYAIVFLFSVSVLNAQEKVNEVQVGDVFEIGRPETNMFQYVDFPSADFILKRGGIANYKSVEGNKVVVSAIKEKKDGTTKVKIKRKDGQRFFGSHTVIAVDFDNAVESGELLAR